MKRIVEFNINGEKYIFTENGEEIFEVSHEDMQFDVKKFYEAFFEGEKEYKDIEIKNLVEDDKIGKHICQIVCELLKEVISKLDKMDVEEVGEE